MPAKEIYHETVKTALVKDGWTVTDDPYRIECGEKNLYVDLGAERLLIAEKESRKIAVEVKSFLGPSDMRDLETALGQYILYYVLMAQQEPDRVLYLAVPKEAYADVFEDPVGRLILHKERLRLIVFDPQQEVILQWIP